MKNLPLPFAIGSALMAAASVSHAAITSYYSDFNSGSGTVTDFYRSSTGNAAADFTWDAGAGVGGGGGVLIGSSASNK